ncbi:hypothetical protein [Halobacterium salinarum]|uniref:hypothetical protein n=1 Tax=Halobacterium salinarum TaxID=2242 RepID=UPI00255799B2|nr:hypothetical protein [Halobacterium salinarum]MDL0128512.1 hypothetical protein [Halobacterium salinarum]
MESDQPVLIEAPPSSGKTYNSVELATRDGIKVTYLAARRDLYQQARKLAEKRPGLNVETIPSPYRNCPTFAGENDGETKKARRLYSKGQSGLKIHDVSPDIVYTPCRGDCEYVSQLRALRRSEERDEIDLLIGNHQHAYNQTYLEGRVVVFDEFNPSPFVSQFPSSSSIRDAPSELISEFLNTGYDVPASAPFREFPFTDITDLVEARTRQSEDWQRAVEWFEVVGADRVTTEALVEPAPHRYDTSHVSSPLLTLSILLAEKTGAGMELAHEPEVWESVGVPRNTRCVRNRNTSEMAVLQPPDGLDAAEQVIGVDAVPTQKLWETVLGCRFTRQRAIPRSELSQYLREGLGLKVLQVGNGTNHYGRGNVSPRDEQRLVAIRAIEETPVPVITTKQARDVYREEAWFEKCVADSDRYTSNTDSSPLPNDRAVLNYATVRSSNVFESASRGFVSGCPYPGDSVIELWTALCGEKTEPRRESGSGLNGFTGFGDDVYRHFVHEQVFQAILRFGRAGVESGDETRVYVNTTALPDFSPANTEYTMIDTQQAPRKCSVIASLIHATHSDDRYDQQTIRTLAEHVEDEVEACETVSTDLTRKVVEGLVSQSMVAVSRGHRKGGADCYEWTGASKLHRGEQRSVIRGSSELYVLDGKRLPIGP